MALPPGSRFGPYELTALLGAGGMGEVYRARDTRLGRDVAIKVLPAGAQSADARQRFAREARVVAALQHPNICSVYDVGDTPDGHGYLVMELLQGETLQQQIARASLPPPSLDHVLDTAVALADALEAAHAAGVVHRDIKPANIVLTPRGPKILDFGIAKTPVDQSPDAATTKGAWRTETGITLGTLAYMSPEQLRGEPVDARSDLFSFGLVLYEMIARRPAFTGDTGVAVAAALLHRQPASLREARPDVPAALEAVVFKALEKDRALRYQHAAELRTDLLRIRRDLTAPSAEVSTSRRPFRKWTTSAAVGVGLALALTAGFLYLRPARAAVLSDTDTIVLADFSNTTGDLVFDDTLRQGLSVQLRQSPFLSLVADTRIRRTLGQMGQPADARLTPQLAAEVCERVGATAVLDGSIASLGTQYVIGLRARMCTTGDLLAEEQTQAARKEDVLDALSRVATAFRARVGESLATVAQYSVPLAEATTPSLEALKAYSAAQRISLTKGSFEAMPMYRRALELDPAFAVAHGGLGLAYSAMGESAASIDHTRRAFELRDRATDRERFYISVLYERQVTGNLEKARQVFDAWLQVYPRDAVAHCLYGGFTTHGTGRLERVIDESGKCLSLDPDIGYGYANTALASILLDRPDQASEALARADARKLQMAEYPMLRYWIAFLRGHQVASDQAATSAGGDESAFMAHVQSLLPALHGALGRARILSHRATEMEQRNGRAESAATFAVSEAVWEAVWGHTDAARARARFALGLATGRDVRFGAAVALALSGDSKSAQPIAEDLASRFPDDTSVQTNYLPVLRAFRSLAANEPARALEALEANRPYEAATPAISFNWFFGGRYPLYLRGVALVSLGRPREAVEELRRLLDRRGLLLADPLGALARVQLARAYAAAGDVANARASYQSFSDLTKDADPGSPLAEQARVELARLK